MLMLLTSFLNDMLDKFSSWFLRKVMELNGYYIAAFFLDALSIMILISTQTKVFVAMQHIVPFFSSSFWAIVFSIGAVFISRIEDNRHTLWTIVLFFIAPLSVFYGTLLLLSNINGVMPFIDTLIVLALLMPTIFVVRTAALNFYREYAAVLEYTIRRLREENDKLKNRKGE